MGTTRGRWGSKCWLLTAALGFGTACDRSPPPPSEEALLNATYLSEWTDEGVVTLAEGEYRAAAGPNRELLIALEESATGDLDGDGIEDAVAVLFEQTSGTETFYRLHALLSDGREVRDVSSRLIGDRVEVRALRIEDGVIEADLLVQRPGEFLTAQPSVPVTTEFVLTNRGLLPAAIPTQGESGPSRSSQDSTHAITGGAWRIVSIRAGENPAVLADATGDLPRLSFIEELQDVDGVSGRLFGSTGCNRVLGSYRASNAGGIRISGLATTLRVCDGDRMEFEQLLTLSLGSATVFEVQGDELGIRFAGGTIHLGRLSDSTAGSDSDAATP
jgi:hypothetical protein